MTARHDSPRMAGPLNGKAKAMTQAELYKAVKALGLSIRKVEGEYRIAFAGDESSAYYTSCRDDALATAKRMASPAPAPANEQDSAETIANDLRLAAFDDGMNWMESVVAGADFQGINPETEKRFGKDNPLAPYFVAGACLAFDMNR